MTRQSWSVGPGSTRSWRSSSQMSPITVTNWDVYNRLGAYAGRPRALPEAENRTDCALELFEQAGRPSGQSSS